MGSSMIRMGIAFLVACHPITINSLAVDGPMRLERRDELTQNVKLAYDSVPDGGPGSTSKRDVDSPSLAKRQGSRPINNCPADGIDVPPNFNFFEESECGPANSQTGYTITCSTGNNWNAQWSDFGGNCRPGEICRNGATVAGRPTTAYCVDGNSFIRLLQAATANATRVVDIDFVGPVTNRALNEEVVLTGQNNNGVMFQATSIEMDAVDSNGKQLGVPQKCTNCDRLSYSSWPVGIAGFLVIVVLPHVNDVALFHSGNNK